MPAAVLHQWDFNPYPVSSMASEFLASIADQPVLCVGAINPRLYEQQLLLGKAYELRKQTGSTLAAALESGPAAAAMVGFLLLLM